MKPKTLDRNTRVQVHWGQHSEPLHEASLGEIVVRWVMTLGICLTIWAVLSPLFYEEFYHEALRTGDFKGWLFWLACFLVPLLLFCVSSTRKVMVKTREQYFPSVSTNNAALPVQQTLVRASSEPTQEQQAVLLRAVAEGQETPPEQLVRPAGEVI